MTIIVSANMERFAVLGADRLVHHRFSRRSAGGSQKIVVHKRLPIAIAIAGRAMLPVSPTSPDGQLVSDVINELFDEVQSWTNHTLAERLEQRLLPSIIDLMHRFGESLQTTPIALWIASANSAGAELWQLTFAPNMTVQAQLNFSVLWHPPPRLLPGIDASPVAGRVEPAVTQRSEQLVACVVHDVIKEAARLDAELSPEAITVGGGADVVVVDAHGVRAWTP